MPLQVVEKFLQVHVIKVSDLDFSGESLCCTVHAEVLAESHEVVARLALPKHPECSVIGELFMDNIGEDIINLPMFLMGEDVP